MTTPVTGSGMIITKPVEVSTVSRVEGASAFDVSIAAGGHAEDTSGGASITPL
jgi:hypothetical protein